jgi:DNA-binding NarL/FixJ family response regulator
MTCFAVAPDRNNAGHGAGCPSVLIVDDQPSFRGLARELLEGRGYRVAGEAADATAAIDAIERLAPDAVLLDVGLGGESGFDLCTALTRAWPSLAVLLVSNADYAHAGGLVKASGARASR